MAHFLSESEDEFFVFSPSCRKLVANAFNIKLAHSHFTSNYSNNCAKIAGYQEDLRFTFDELEATIPGLNYGDVDSKFYGVYSWQF